MLMLKTSGPKSNVRFVNGRDFLHEKGRTNLKNCHSNGSTLKLQSLQWLKLRFFNKLSALSEKDTIQLENLPPSPRRFDSF